MEGDWLCRSGCADTHSLPRSAPTTLLLRAACPGFAGGAAAMSSPSKRREMDVMKLCGAAALAFPACQASPGRLARRLMSDWKVEMANDSMAEFHVEFHGPKESASRRRGCPNTPVGCHSTT